MHRSESDELLTCAGCGALVAANDRVYGLGADSLLCFSCAVGRGGVYDAVHDRWTQDPELSDVAEPER